MMRSLFSGVAGLKTHQTRMDVIGNNIANVNTTAYKSMNMVFSDLLYQQTQAASGANAATGRGGINARQIGLGAKTGAISTAITRQGSAQSTNNPWDIMLTGESFFIVNSGSQNFFTRDGSFTIDGAGNLVMASTGYRVMGWQVDEETGDIRSDVVSALQVMNRDNLTAPAESTTMGYASGILDKNDTDVRSSTGKIITLNFFDNLGYQYTARMSVHGMREDGNYYVELDDILNSEGVSLKDYYNLNDISQIASFGEGDSVPPITKVYSVPKGVTYTPPAGAANATFKVDYPHSQTLTSYSNNPMLCMAEDTIKITQIGTTKPPTDGMAVAGKVTLEGTVELTKDVLQNNPYKLVFNEKDFTYYYNAGTDAQPDMKPLSNAPKTGGPTGDITVWQNILGALAGGVTLPIPGANDPAPLQVSPDGTVSVTFSAQLDPSGTNYFYNGETGKLSTTIENDMSAANSAKILTDVYGLTDTETVKYSLNYISPDGHASVTISESYKGNMLVFDTKTGEFSYIGNPEQDAATLSFNATATDMTGATVDLGHFSDISIDFASVRNVNNGKVSTMGLDNGDGGENNLGSGRKEGALIGIEVGQDGKITASYDNGLSKLLGQIAVAKFANPAGLAKAGNNLYSTTMNSGEFDGIGVDVTADGEGSMESGVLEMSNVDLAGEFTEMITTQRGFQANSRIITTSDSMLEELVNLKR